MWKFFLVLLITMCSFLSGCRGEKKEDIIELTFVNGWGGTFESHAVMREIYKEFERKNPDIRLKYISYADSATAVEKAIDMLAVGEMADIVSTNGFSAYTEYAKSAGMLMNLAPYIEADLEWKQQIHPAVFDMWLTKTGEMYTLPDVLEVSGYWYNETYLKAAGIEEIPSTWDGFMKMVDCISMKMSDIDVCALEEDQMKLSLFWALLADAKAEDITSLSNFTFEEEDVLYQEILEVLNYMKQHSGNVENIEEAREQFGAGQTALFFGGVWEAYELEKSVNKDTLKFANYPMSDGGSLSIVSASSGYTVAKQSDERKADACIRFLKYMSSKNVQEKIAFSTCQVPVNTQVDVTQILEKRPMFGIALESAYMAEVQIPTMHSVWNASQIEKLDTVMQEY